MAEFQTNHPREVGDPVWVAPERIAILLYPGVEPMDFQGPCAIFDVWHLEAEGPEVILVAESTQPIRCSYGRSITPQYAFEGCPVFEALLVPGGAGRKAAVANPAVINFLKEHGSSCTHLLSVCTGIFLLQAAGLAAGHKVTTHWEYVNELAADSHLIVSGGERYCMDGKLWTAAGIFSGIDLALAFIDSFEGTPRPGGDPRRAEAGKVQMVGQYFPSGRRYPPGPALGEAPDFVQAEFP